LIVNPAFVFWPDGGDSPEAWSLQTPDDSAGVAGIEQVGGRSALRLWLSKGSEDDDLAVARLAQHTTFPTEFAVWVHPTVPSTEPLQQAYGLELDDGEHRLWILFGDSDSYGSLDENFGYVCLPAPLNTWSKHTIHPRELYALFKWELPPFTPRHRDGLAYVARQTQVSLLIASRSQGTSVGVFGPIEQDNELAHPDTLLAETLAHPDVYYVNLGDEYRRERNYDLAQDAYLEALNHDAASAEGWFGLAEAGFWRDDWTGATRAFEKSILYGYRHPAMAYRGMGWAYYNLGELDRAKQAFEEAVRADPGMADAYNGLGWVWLQERRCDRAVPYFERAHALAPDFSDPQRGIEKCTSSQ
jgi:Flp pilus assembly protein TadD